MIKEGDEIALVDYDTAAEEDIMDCEKEILKLSKRIEKLEKSHDEQDRGGKKRGGKTVSKNG